MRQGLAAQITVPGNALIALLALFGAVAAPRIGQSSHAAFYALVAVLYFLLSLGPGSILFSLYARLPLGSAFRAPARLLCEARIGGGVQWYELPEEVQR